MRYCGIDGRHLKKSKIHCQKKGKFRRSDEKVMEKEIVLRND